MVIEARFPLGVFLGHRPDGTRADFPDAARLHAALTNAAGQGTTARLDGRELRPSDDAIEALRWLEEHPPECIRLPNAVPVAAATGERPARSWRDEGVLEGQANLSPRKVLKSQSDGSAVAGPVGWGWEDAVPSGVREMLDALCADVSCLGEADSPVILELVDPAGWEPTHELDQNVTAFPAPGGLKMRTPVAGRFDELEEDHQRANPAKLPSTAADRHSWSAKPASHRPSAVRARERVYRDD
jgi:CRISPR-associated protein Csb2